MSKISINLSPNQPVLITKTSSLVENKLTTVDSIEPVPDDVKTSTSFLVSKTIFKSSLISFNSLWITGS